MANRDKGILGISANFEPQVAAPLDGRNVVKELANLTNATSWQANDGSVYIYKGLVTSVTDDVDLDNNGLYILKDLPYTNINNWKKIGSDLGDNALKLKLGSITLAPDGDNTYSYLGPDALGKLYIKNNSVVKRLDVINTSLFANGDMAVYNNVTNEFDPILIVEDTQMIRQAIYNVMSNNNSLFTVLPGYGFDMVIKNNTGNIVDIEMSHPNGVLMNVTSITANSLYRHMLSNTFLSDVNSSVITISSSNWNNANLTFYILQTKII